jgi:formylmethanofuran dehydrogenase subunit D
VLVDARDLAALGLREGERVTVSNEFGFMTGNVKVGPCRSKHVQAFWPEANVLLARKYDPASGEPEYATTVEIARAPNEPRS